MVRHGIAHAAAANSANGRPGKKAMLARPAVIY